MLRYPLLLLALLPLAACGGPADRYGAPQSAGEAAQLAATAAAADWARAEALTVMLDSYEFVPNALTFRAGRAYRLTLVNDGDSAHTFAAPEFFRAVAARALIPGGAAPEAGQPAPPLESVALAAGARRTLEFVAVTPGSYDLECDRPLHGVFGMTGTLRIE
jgi:uncharacterized cupredoxin-like copper-binding protein